MNEKEFNRDEYISECYATPAHNVRRPHKHAELIKAWADGAEIEWRHYGYTDWKDAQQPNWNPDVEYRIKPEPKPDVVKKMMYLYFVGTNEQKFWISDEPPETYVYRTISQYIGSVEVLK